ncbi:MAG: hypothetical protein N3A38_08505 [Planctomycetota bacterium]|nr:hypothetical protein [Planctomycetota bacterium]
MRAARATTTAAVAVAFFLVVGAGMCAAGRRAVEESGWFKIRFDRAGRDRIALRLDVRGLYDSNRDERLAGALLAVNVGGVEFSGTADEKARVRTGLMRARLAGNGSVLSIKVKKVALAPGEGNGYSEFAAMDRDTRGETRTVPLSVYVTATKDGSTVILYDETLAFLYRADGRQGKGLFASRL